MADWLKTQGHMIHVSKGVYFMQDNDLWKVYRRAIYCDGVFCPSSKSDVAHIMLRWCQDNSDVIHDRRIKDPLSFLDALKEQERIFKWCDKKDYTIDDLTIYVCHSIMMMTEVKMFEEVIMPSENVMPFNIDVRSYEDEHQFKRIGVYIDAIVDERRKVIKEWYAERGAVEKEIYSCIDNLYECIFKGDLTYKYYGVIASGRVCLDMYRKEITLGAINSERIATIGDDGTIKPSSSYISLSDKDEESLKWVLSRIDYRHNEK